MMVLAAKSAVITWLLTLELRDAKLVFWKRFLMPASRCRVPAAGTAPHLLWRRIGLVLRTMEVSLMSSAASKGDCPNAASSVPVQYFATFSLIQISAGYVWKNKNLLPSLLTTSTVLRAGCGQNLAQNVFERSLPKKENSKHQLHATSKTAFLRNPKQTRSSLLSMRPSTRKLHLENTGWAG